MFSKGRSLWDSSKCLPLMEPFQCKKICWHLFTNFNDSSNKRLKKLKFTVLNCSVTRPFHQRILLICEIIYAELFTIMFVCMTVSIGSGKDWIVTSRLNCSGLIKERFSSMHSICRYSFKSFRVVEVCVLNIPFLSLWFFNRLQYWTVKYLFPLYQYVCTYFGN